MTHIQQTIQDITAQLPPQTRLVAVSKYHPSTAIREAYEAGQRIFGESHVQELRNKEAELPKDIQWHFIGHLQTNKVKYIAPYISLIHAVDSEKLLAEIHKQGIRCNRRIPCLLQLHIAQEETKFGFTMEECTALLEKGILEKYPNAQVCGLMCMASNVDDSAQIEMEFESVHHYFKTVKDRFFADNTEFTECSWGMSDDYPLAVEHGSTLVRIGSKIFGLRQ